MRRSSKHLKQSSSRTSKLSALTAPARAFDSLTRSQQRQLDHRLLKLSLFASLCKSGFSKTQAAKQIRVSFTTIWRWNQRLAESGIEGLIPSTGLCGRKSAASQFVLTGTVIASVQRLQLGGSTNAEAWRAFASDPDCPAPLAKFLKAASSVPSRFLEATRFKATDAIVIQGVGFTHIAQPKTQ